MTAPDRPGALSRSDVPSERAVELIRTAVRALVAEPGELLAAVDGAVLGAQPDLADPELTEAIRASNRSNLVHWATATLANPGLPVPLNRSEETLNLARLIARRGIEDTSQVAYSAVQSAAWTEWMRAVFATTAETTALLEVLNVSARVSSAFVQGMLSLLRSEMARERGQMLSAENLARLSLINRLLDDGLSDRSAQDLHYPVDRHAQTAVVLHLPGSSERMLALVEQVAVTLRARLRHRPLSVAADAATVWAWFVSDPWEGPFDTTLESAFSAAIPGRARVAIGPTREGFEGFRGLRDAQAAAEVADAPVVTYERVVLAALVRAEPARVRAFVASRIGRLRPAEKEILATYLAQRCSATRTAAVTFSHRNTVQERVRRAVARLPVPLEGHELEIGVALELARHYGTGVLPSGPLSSLGRFSHEP